MKDKLLDEEWTPTPNEEPVIVDSGNNINDTKETHPSYGVIGASRVQGNICLFGSDFIHHNFVTISIRKAELGRGLSNDRPFGYHEIVEVALSEAQWATFVSSMNVGQGVQCTIQHIDQKRVPGISAPKDRHKQFKIEADKRLDEFGKQLQDLSDNIGKLNLGVKAKEALQFQIKIMKSNLKSNLKFTADQFTEHMEKVTEHAKIEVNAYLENVIHRTGLQALQGTSPIALPNKDEK